LAQIERATRQKIGIVPIPTVKDLLASRLDRTRQQLREALAKTDALDELRNLVGELAKEFTPTDVAIAALSLLSQPSRPEDNTDFQSGHGPRDVQQEQSRPGMHAKDETRRVGGRPPKPGMAKIYFDIGRDSGVTIRDLVEVMGDEAGIPSKDVGAIELTNQFALVEVPNELAEYVIEVMQGVRIRRRKFNVRVERPPLQSPKTGGRVPLGV
jgi:ATP-dependent RNA helicase DeaD